MRRLLAILLFLPACGSDNGTPGTLAAAGSSGASASGGSTASGGSSGRGSGGSGASSGGSGASSGGSGGSGASSGGSAEGGSGGSGASSGGAQSFGEPRTGNFWLGPVDYVESEWHNACAPTNKYPAGIQALYGNYIMGLANEATLDALTAGVGELCDVCAERTANGTTLIAHVVTYGQETGPNDIDVSPEVDAALNGSAGRTVTWQFVSCPTADPIQYTFDGRDWTNVWFFRVWVRNSRLPITSVEYRIGNAAWASADWQTDGAFQAASQDFSGGFALRVTAIDGQTLEDALPGLDTFDPDVGVASHGNFQ
jgi:hypothetical protein